ncbi:hypothetical protein [Hyphobacterium sp.]|uniref:hypothetical protein n=1 Tax=Hyphobacterium sp. TaxID=2004662 RepID=UPI003BACC1B9
MRRKPPLAVRFLYVVLFLAVGGSVLMGIALWADPIKRCEERGGTFHIAGRWCEEAPETP